MHLLLTYSGRTVRGHGQVRRQAPVRRREYRGGDRNLALPNGTCRFRRFAELAGVPGDNDLVHTLIQSQCHVSQTVVPIWRLMLPRNREFKPKYSDPFISPSEQVYT